MSGAPGSPRRSGGGGGGGGREKEHKGGFSGREKKKEMYKGPWTPFEDAAVTALVYRKAFLLSAKGRQDFKVGELVSLMSVDAQRLCSTAPYIHQFWSSPMQLVVSVVLLYGTVGAPQPRAHHPHPAPPQPPASVPPPHRDMG